MVHIHVHSTKHITIANIYIALWDNTSTLLIQPIDTTHFKLNGDRNAHSTLSNSCTDDHREQIIADIINNHRRHTTQNRHTNKNTKHNTTTHILTRYYNKLQQPGEHSQITRKQTGYIIFHHHTIHKLNTPGRQT